MSKHIDFSHLGGFPFTQEMFAFMQEAYKQPLNAIAAAYGNKIIISGVEDLGATYGDGWVIIDGVPMPFMGGLKAPNIVVETITGDETFGDGATRTVYFDKQAKSATVGGYPHSEFKRYKTDSINFNDSDVVASAKAVKKLNDNMLSMLSFETAIILKGCLVTPLTVNTLSITAGVAMVDNTIIATPAYNGTYPVYLKPDATFATVDPGGARIKFDPHTSQRYADVLKRATTSSGEIKMFKTLSNRFDASGVGKWEMQGFKICDALQSRVPLGYDRRSSDPFDNVFDWAHTMPGNTGGEKRAALYSSNLPSSISVTIAGKMIKKGGTANGVVVLDVTPVGGESADPSYGNKDVYTTINNPGGDQRHENRQPFLVVVYAERI